MKNKSPPTMVVLPDMESMALLEIDGLPRAMLAHDAALKRAPVSVVACTPVPPGKALLMFHGDVAAVFEAFECCHRIAGSRLIDALLLPMVHPAVIAALGGERHPHADDALAVMEFTSVAATLLAADTAVKCCDVRIGRLHLACGFGGKGFFTLHGALCDVEAAVDAAVGCAQDRVADCEIVAAPHDGLAAGSFVRPWASDPVGG